MSAGTLTETFPTAPPQVTNEQRVSEPFLSDPARISRFLGWFSIGLGAAELLAPRAIARVAGTRHHAGVTRFYGMREIAAAVGIFTHPNPAPWLWARVAGDVVDLASIVGGSTKGRRLAAVGALAAVAGSGFSSNGASARNAGIPGATGDSRTVSVPSPSAMPQGSTWYEAQTMAAQLGLAAGVGGPGFVYAEPVQRAVPEETTSLKPVAPAPAMSGTNPQLSPLPAAADRQTSRSPRPRCRSACADGRTDI